MSRKEIVARQLLGYLAVVTLLLATAWTVWRWHVPGVPTVAAPDRRPSYVMMQVAYGLASDGATGPLTLAPLQAAPDAAGAVGGVGVGRADSGARLRILAIGLPTDSGSTPSEPEYTAVAYRADGAAIPLGPLTLITSQRRWVLSVPLNPTSLPVRRVVILRWGEPIMQAFLESTQGAPAP